MEVQALGRWQRAVAGTVTSTAKAAEKRTRPNSSQFEARNEELRALLGAAIRRLPSTGLAASYGIAIKYFMPGAKPLVVPPPLVVLFMAEYVSIEGAPCGRPIFIGGTVASQPFLFGLVDGMLNLAACAQSLIGLPIGFILLVSADMEVSDSFELISIFSSKSEYLLFLEAVIIARVTGFLPLIHAQGDLLLGARLSSAGRFHALYWHCPNRNSDGGTHVNTVYLYFSVMAEANGSIDCRAPIVVFPRATRTVSMCIILHSALHAPFNSTHNWKADGPAFDGFSASAFCSAHCSGDAVVD